MDLKVMFDGLAQNAQPLAVALFMLSVITLLLRTKLAKRLMAGIEKTFFENWQLGLLATTGLVLSAASGWTTWDGMRNFTGEPLLSGMITFGIQGVMLIVAWLIGESFATGMNMQPVRGKEQSGVINPNVQTWLGAGIGLLLFIAGLTLFLQWTGQADIRAASTQDISWSKTGDKFLMFGVGLLLVALFALYAASDLVKPYIQGFRVIVRNSVLWIMFLACMATSVFFSFDSLFTSIFPQSERVRAAELRAQNQVAGIVADIEQTISSRRATLAETLFTTEAWTGYEAHLDNIAKAAAQSEGAIERYVNNQIETRRRAVKEQQERMASAQSGQAGLAGRKISLTEEKSRIAGQRPELAAEYAAKKAEYDAKLKDADAKRVEAMAEDKGVEGTGKEGRGPIYRQRMSELNLLQAAGKIAEERMKDAQKRLTGVETRLAAIDRELAMLDGDLAKLKGEAETADQRIKLAEDTAKGDTAAPKLDPSRILPAFERAKADFRSGPTTARLNDLQRMCGDIAGALSSTPETKALLAGIDCDPKVTADAAAELFQLQSGIQTFQNTCMGGDKLVANNSADALFSFARKCLADSALPSKDTDVLRTKINYIELSRDDKAHRFVVTWNAFQDGNRLAYLALAIAFAIDSLIFMSGLFGANAVRSPLSDVPSYKARSASQLEATINAALGPHPHETAWLTLNTLRPITNSDGFSAMADLSTMERSSADRVRMVLTAGADIGAVETASVNPERYRVRSELREYLSGICDKHFKTNASAKDHARLDQLVSAALAPHPREHADLVLHTLEPIRETEGFTSMVTLSDIPDAYENRVVRRVMNAGSTVKAVAPDIKIDDRYYISPKLYEVLLTIRATAQESANYEFERRRFAGIQERPAIDGGALRSETASLPPQMQKAQLTHSDASLDAHHQLVLNYYSELIDAIGFDDSSQIPALDDVARGAAAAANAAFDKMRNEYPELNRRLLKRDEEVQTQVDSAHSLMKNALLPSDAKRSALSEAAKLIDDNWPILMLMPRGPFEREISQIVTELEYQHGEGQLDERHVHALKTIKRLRDVLRRSNRTDQLGWKQLTREFHEISVENDMPKIAQDKNRRV